MDSRGYFIREHQKCLDAAKDALESRPWGPEVERFCDKKLAEAREHGREIENLDRQAVDRKEKARMTTYDESPFADGGGKFLGGGRSLAAELRTKGWNPKAPIPVEFGVKAVIDTVADASPQRRDGVVELPIDSRYAYANLPQAPLANGTSAVQELVATTRDLADPGMMQIPYAGSATKPVSTVGASLETFTPQMIATRSELIPNAIFGLPAFERLVDVTLRQAYRDGLDAYVVNGLLAGAGTFDDTGADLFVQLRNAKENLESLGYAPNLALVSPANAKTLDLTRGVTDGAFLLDPAPRGSGFSPLWSMQVVKVKGINGPIVLDSSAVTLFVGNVQFATNPYEAFDSNQTRARLEGPACLVVHQGDGIQVVGDNIS